MASLIYNVTAVRMDENHTVLPNAWVLVEGEHIAAVGSGPAPECREAIDGKGGILLPGLINAHTHVPMTAMRGYGDGHDLHD